MMQRWENSDEENGKIQTKLGIWLEHNLGKNQNQYFCTVWILAPFIFTVFSSGNALLRAKNTQTPEEKQPK